MKDDSGVTGAAGPKNRIVSAFADVSNAGRRIVAAPPLRPAAPGPAAGAPTGRVGPAGPTLPRGWRRTFISLRNRDYLYLWLGFMFAWAGLSMQMLARGYLAYDLTGSAGLLGLITAAGALSMAALSLIGGAVADRANRKHLIQGFQAASALLALVIALLIAVDMVAWWHLLIAAVVQGALFAFMAPARQAVIPDLVPKEQVNNAIALNAAGMSITALLAPAIGGLVYAVAGPEAVYFVVSSLAVGALLLTSKLPDCSGRGDSEPRPASEITSEIKAGLLYAFRSQTVLVLLVASVGMAILAAPFQFLMPALIVDVYGRGPEAMGLLTAATGIGALVGSLAVASMRSRRRGRLLIFASLVTGVSLLLVSAVPFFIGALLLMVPLGLGQTARMTLNQALLIEHVGERYRGRVMSVFMLTWGLMPLGVLPAGLLADWAGVQVSLGVMAALLIAVTVLIYATQPRLRQLS